MSKSPSCCVYHKHCGLHIDSLQISIVPDRRVYFRSRNVIAGLFSEGAMEWAIKKKETEPTLKMMTEKAIKIMQSDRKGFFLMVEGGLIDVGQHRNSMHKTFAEMEAFEDAIRQAREMTDPSETLILVTADHAHALTITGYAFLNESIFGEFLSKVVSY
ncbi:hypothetical protein COOONC_01954 [Cooperia oncophora]